MATRAEALEHLKQLKEQNPAMTRREALEALRVFKGREVVPQITEEPKQDLGLILPEEGLLTPIQEEEKRFKEVIQPQQQIAKESTVMEAKERKARRKAGEATIGEKIEDVLLTRDVTESGDQPSALADVTGVLSLPARTLGAVFGIGEIEEESTKLLKSAIEGLNKWADNPENEGFTTEAARLLGNVALETASDPLAIAGALKGAVTQTAKSLGKTVTSKQVDDLVEMAAKKSGRKVEKKAIKAGGKDVKAEQLLVDAGGPKQVVKRLDDKGIKISTAGQRSIPQKKTREIIDKLKATRIEEFDVTDKIESTIVPIKQKNFLVRALRGNVTGTPSRIADDIIAAKGNPSEIQRVLRRAGFKDPGLVDNASGVLSRLQGDITGEEARDLIADLNSVIGDPKKAKTGTKIQLMKIKEGIEGELKKAIGDRVPDDALESYIALRETGTEKFATKTGKLSNIIKRNPDKTINEQKSVQALEKMIDDAMGEVGRGEKGLAVQNLKEIDELAGTDIAEIAELLGLDERFALGVKGDVGAVPATVKAPPKRSIVEGSVVGGHAGGTAVALRNITSDIVNKANKKKIANLVNFMAKEKGKLKMTTKRLSEIKRDIEEGKKFLLSEIERGNAVKLFDVMTSKGFISVKQLVSQLGREKALKVATEAKNSNDMSVRKMGKKMEQVAK
jgi:hypothetical protein